MFASDRDGGRFRLYAAGVTAASAASPSAPEPLLDVPGGAMWPEISADGASIAFVSAHGGGFDVYEAPFNASAASAGAPVEPWPAGSGARRSAHQGVGDPGDPLSKAPGDEGAPYSPWQTLWPRAWTPLLISDGSGVQAGARVSGSDVLGYHAYAIEALWRLTSPTPAASVSAGRPDWSASYVYARWRPSLLVALSDAIDAYQLHDAATGTTVNVDEEQREVFAGMVVPWRRIRTSSDLLLGVDLSGRRSLNGSNPALRRRNAVRAAWTVTTAHLFGYSISPERGTRTTVTSEHVSPLLGADGQAVSTTCDARVYAPGFGGHHVLAFRVAAGAGTGDPRSRRVFSLGGSSLPASPFSFGRQALGLLRGLDADTLTGLSIGVANADYRFPLSRIERGVGQWPVFLKTLHGAVFADVGSTGRSLDSLGEAAWSVGAELASDLTIGYSWGLTLAGGVAWSHDPTRAGTQSHATAFIRTGYAF
ncbi:MAG: BamA/TamA family outer membrane protein [Acidobacteria bacterium]|nr:BamA/TamA family outer membrane protein [Acidobacteriota bacterium]